MGSEAARQRGWDAKRGGGPCRRCCIQTYVIGNRDQVFRSGHTAPAALMLLLGLRAAKVPAHMSVASNGAMLLGSTEAWMMQTDDARACVGQPPFAIAWHQLGTTRTGARRKGVFCDCGWACTLSRNSYIVQHTATLVRQRVSGAALQAIPRPYWWPITDCGLTGVEALDSAVVTSGPAVRL